ncbi:MAG: PKD domain-containing protein [Candidatus Peribacteraceae bacterium]|nr:PKD domain-containing protein [Candidatus Peribacteraceae bacterium]
MDTQPAPLPNPDVSVPASVDGLTSAPQPAPVSAPPPVAPTAVRAQKRVLVGIGFLFYALYAGWCLWIMAQLPTIDIQLSRLQQPALASVAIGGVFFIGLALILLQRVARADVGMGTRQQGLIRVLLAVVPGIALSAAVPFVILQAPSFPMDTDPADAASFVAPLSITLNVARSAAFLQAQGKKPSKYMWYTDASGKATETTVAPETTMVFQRAGIYPISVRLVYADGTYQKISKQIIIGDEVFAVSPLYPIVDQPARFSIAQLIPDVKQLKQAQWDFDGDGTAEETTKGTDAVHTYYATGDVTVTVIVDLANQTQKTYSRMVTVQDPPSLPFPVTLKTEPKTLLGPSPFGVLFTLETEESLKEITWSFGDGKQERGADLTRIGHSFDKPGIYSVMARARSGSGKLAELSALVRVTDTLQIADLTYEGKPEVRNNIVTGEVPLTVQLTPKTALPLIQFSWEAPDEMGAEITGNTVAAVLRREGAYTLTLIAQGPDGNTMRQPIKINVRPPAAEPVIDMRPEGGTAPLRVTFDASRTYVPPNEVIAGFRWQFGDEAQGATPELGGSRLEHTYEKAGEYKVKLTLVTTKGKEYSAERTLIIRKPVLSACATASRVQLSAGGGVRFDASCTTGKPTQYLWDVRSEARPGTTLAQSEEKTYDHVFAEPGEYRVTLTVHDGAGSQDAKTLSISVSAP